MKKFIFATIFISVGLFLGSIALALTVSPVKLEISGDPGQEVSGEFILFNEQGESKTFYSSFANFEAQGETGTPTFVPGNDGLAAWIETVSKITLEAGERITVPFTIKIPQDTDPGGHFAAVFWSATPPQAEGEGQVSVATKLGVLILLRVSGEIEEGGGILKFGAENEQKFFNSLPVNLVFRFQNSGNDRVKPEGEITIKNIFGKVSAVLPANKSKGNVLPQSVRKFEIIWEKIQEEENKEINKTKEDTEKKGFFEELKNEKENFAFGKYTAELDLKYNKENAQASFSFFIIPWRILMLAIIGLIMAFLIIIKGMKRYNKRVIAKAVKALEETKIAETKEVDKINKTETNDGTEKVKEVKKINKKIVKTKKIQKQRKSPVKRENVNSVK